MIEEFLSQFDINELARVIGFTLKQILTILEILTILACGLFKGIIIGVVIGILTRGMK